MNRDHLAAALGAQPFDHDVVVNIAGTYVDASMVRTDGDRQVIVVDLLGDDLIGALQRFFRTGPGHSGSGNSL